MNASGTTLCSNMLKKTTRGRGTNKSNLLDLILSNEEDNIGEIKYFSPLGKSYHSVILCNVAINNYTIKRKCFNMANYDEMRTDLPHINWEDEFRLCKDNVNDQWEILKTIRR